MNQDITNQKSEYKYLNQNKNIYRKVHKKLQIRSIWWIVFCVPEHAKTCWSVGNVVYFVGFTFKEDEAIYYCHLSDNEKYEDIVAQLQNVENAFYSGSLVDEKLKMFGHFAMDYLCGSKRNCVVSSAKVLPINMISREIRTQHVVI